METFLPEFAEERPSLVAIVRGAFPGGQKQGLSNFHTDGSAFGEWGRRAQHGGRACRHGQPLAKLKTSHGGARVDLLI